MRVIPPIYEFALIALAAYRAWRLLSEDEILDRPRHRIVRLPMSWQEGDTIPLKYRDGLATFLSCAWCSGAWVTLVAYVIWMVTIGNTPSSTNDVFSAIGVWLALSAVVGIIRAKLDPPDL